MKNQTPDTTRPIAADAPADTSAETLVCVATATCRPDAAQSQDAARAVPGGPGTFPFVAVADGIGSQPRAGEGARFAVDAFTRLLESPARRSGLPGLFREVQRELAAEADRELRGTDLEALPRHSLYGTTLLTAVASGELHVAYVGNGAVFHLPGCFAHSGEEGSDPWGMVNLLNPHSWRTHGRDGLFRYLAGDDDRERAAPTVRTLYRDRQAGDVLLLCTDGVYSADQITYGDPGDGNLWAQVPTPLRAVYAALRDAFLAPGPLTGAGLTASLQTCLDGLRDRGELYDDTTVGLLVTGEAVRWRERHQGSHPRPEGQG